MNNQEVYDKVKAHLLTQNAKSISKDGDCKYRMIRSTKRCAIGCLIPDELYSKDLEGEGVYTLAQDEELGLKDFFAGVSIDLLVDLQCMHDGDKPSKWPTILNEIAKDYGLTP